MKKAVLVAVVIAVLVGYGFVTLKSRKPNNPALQATTSTPATKKADPKTVTIVYDKNGFSPNMVEITKGTTIKFVNKWTDMPMWVASDPHPQHASYPEMDTSAEFQSEVPPGNESYSFTFEKAGTWGYHNHSAPEHIATVVVK